MFDELAFNSLGVKRLSKLEKPAAPEVIVCEPKLIATFARYAVLYL